MTLDEWEAALRQALDAAGFDPAGPNLALGWDVFRRLLMEAVDHDLGATVWAGSTLSADYAGREVYALRFVRTAGTDITDWNGVALVFEFSPPDPLEHLRFVVAQEEEEGGPLLPYDEFMDRCYACAEFHQVLAHAAGWQAQVLAECYSD